MATFLRQSTQVIARFGPYIDKTDGFTEEVGLAGAATEISKNHAAFGAGPTLGTHDADGWYPITLTTTHTDTLGPFIVKGHDNATHLPVWREFLVVNTAIFDAFCASSGGAIPNAVAGAAGGLFIAGSNAATTLASLTVTAATTLTGNVALADGLTIAAPSTAGRAGITVTGNGAGAGAIITGGATGNGVTLSAGATSGHGLIATATGTSFNGVRAVGSPTTGEGLRVIGGSTSGDGIGITTTSGHAISAVASGTTKHGIVATGGATTSHGISATGGGVGHGILATSGGGATGDGINATAASANGNGATFAKTGSGKDLNATSTPLTLVKTTNITGLNDIAATDIVTAGAITTSAGKVSGVILTDTVTTYTGNTLQTADVATLIATVGVAGASLTDLGGMSTGMKAQVQVEAEDALVTHRLDELVNADSDIDGAAPPTVGSVFHELLTKTAGSFTYDQSTDSNEAIRDNMSAAVLDDVVEGTTTFRQLLRLFASALLARVSGLPLAPVFRDIGNTKDRITATTDADGNRTAVTLDGA
jgi:hypothetical protein